MVIDWLKAARHGGVHVYERSRSRFVPWSQVLRDAEAVTSRLVSAGISPGDRIGIRGHNSYQWLVVDLALLGLGAVPVAFPVPDFVGVANAELAARYQLTAMFAGQESRSDDCQESVAALEQVLLGPVDLAPARPDGEPDPEVFTLAFSSGTAGRVKCLMLGWGGVAALVRAHSAAYPFRHDDRIMIALPLSTFQQRYLSYLAIYNDCDIVLTTTARFVQSLPATRPTILLGPPSFYEFAENRYRSSSSWNRRRLDVLAYLAAAIPVAPLRRRWRRMVFREFHNVYGGSVRLMLVGSAPVMDGMLDFFARAGFEFYQIYGMTEIGYISWNRPGFNVVGSVGREVYPGSVELADDGEILVRHKWHLCVRYEGASAQDAAAVFRGPDTIATGDLGEFGPDGYLYIKGRKKNLILTKGGQKLQAEDLESELCRIAGVHQAALLRTAEGLAVAVFYEGEPRSVRTSLLACLTRINSRLIAELSIRQFALVQGALSADSPLFNRNLKINRDAVGKAVAGQLEPVPAGATPVQ
jgi:long-chain acyl-CoA synthetase